jgi:hypothetical protein
MAESAVRRTEAGMKSVKRNNPKDGCNVKHAHSVLESCGSIGAGGSRCDRPPHTVVLRHHCCGETWEKAW